MGMSNWSARCCNAAFNRMIDAIERVAVRSRAPLLLVGPTGAGKSQLASRIYELKHARHQPAAIFNSSPVRTATFELDRFRQTNSTNVRFNAEARAAYTRFAISASAQWTGNFRELSASVSRMATLSDGGRISEAVVNDEIERLLASWRPAQGSGLEGVLSPTQIDGLDLFDRLQLEAVVSVCRRSTSMADAGRKLFAATRTRRTSRNDSDRLRKYLARFDLDWAATQRTGAN
jgi:sigma54-dependent transcription regulator